MERIQNQYFALRGPGHLERQSHADIPIGAGKTTKSSLNPHASPADTDPPQRPPTASLHGFDGDLDHGCHRAGGGPISARCPG